MQTTKFQIRMTWEELRRSEDVAFKAWWLGQAQGGHWQVEGDGGEFLFKPGSVQETLSMSSFHTLMTRDPVIWLQSWIRVNLGSPPTIAEQLGSPHPGWSQLSESSLLSSSQSLLRLRRALLWGLDQLPRPHLWQVKALSCICWVLQVFPFQLPHVLWLYWPYGWSRCHSNHKGTYSILSLWIHVSQMWPLI